MDRRGNRNSARPVQSDEIVHRRGPGCQGANQTSFPDSSKIGEIFLRRENAFLTCLSVRFWSDLERLWENTGGDFGSHECNNGNINSCTCSFIPFRDTLANRNCHTDPSTRRADSCGHPRAGSLSVCRKWEMLAWRSHL